MRILIAALVGLLLCGTASAAPAPSTAPAPAVHGLAMYGQPKYPAGFTHFDYANPDAPKGGELRLQALGTFDSLNPFIVKGQPASTAAMPFESLLIPSADEPFTEYGLIAESVEVPEDRSWVVFNLRSQARFHDGSPITADDVLFSFDILKSKGSPFYRAYYSSVTRAEKLADRKVRFVFAAGENRELPLIIGQMPILSKKYWQNRAFDQTTLDPPLGSGPYKVESLEAGRYIVMARVPDYWGKDLPVNKGLYNFDRIRTDYYLDSTAALEGFKAGDYDVRIENESKKWATAYNFPAVSEGLVKVSQFPNQRPTGMQGYAFNTRRPLFQDPKVREALAYAFDFEWTNKTLFYGQYVRTKSYFSNSDLASGGLPSPEEMKLLEPLKTEIPPEVFTTEYAPPEVKGPEGLRNNLRIAARMLKEAGWVVKDNRLVNAKTGQPFVFEILLDQPVWERISLPFAQNLQRLGIAANVRTVDTAQYKNRVDTFDFDMIVEVWGESESPGNEQREFWGSAAAGMEGSRNVIGVKSKAIDTLIDKVVSAPDRPSLVTRVHALDRVLLWGHYVIPHWHITYDRVAYWDKFGMPQVIPRQGFQLMSWWTEPDKARRVPPPKKAAEAR